jgi:radical SAM family uncharacterized protein
MMRPGRPAAVPEARLLACLERVFKPARYIGGEVNLVRKDPAGKVLFGLVYPDLYDLGMANLSLKILYEILNRLDFVAAERAFLPDLDMQKEMRRRRVPLWSLENRLLLGSFDFLGFTIQTELCATNILQTLSLAGLDPLGRNRGPRDPIVVGGGPTLSNPEPYADFFDLFVIGDAETVLPGMMALYRKARTRAEFFDTIRGLAGVYIPGDWAKTVQVREGLRKIVSIRNTVRPDVRSVATSLVQDLDAAVFPVRQVVPLLNIPQDRAVLEVSRGCLNNCRFCQAGYFYRPLRERSPETLERLAAELIRATGHSTISMLSLSISNYSNLTELIVTLNRRLRKDKVTLSLPSLRIDAFVMDTLGQYKDVKKTGLTFALESMSPRVRRFLNKDLDMDNFREIVKKAVERKWKSVKIYLMWGFPVEGEVEENIRGMLEFADFIRTLGRPVNVSFHLTPFIPKPGTPLQWLTQVPLAKLKEDLALMKREVRRKNVSLKWHDLRMAWFEAVVTKADRDMGAVIHEAWKKGAMFDAWDEKFRFDLWKPLLEKYERTHRLEEKDMLPWDHIDFGYRKGFFLSEFGRSQKGEVTPDCRDDGCYACGVCTERKNSNVIHAKRPPAADTREEPAAKHTDQDPFFFLELTFVKQGLLRYISHLDLIHLFEKVLNVSGLDLRMSFGFSPHRKMSFPFPLALGIESTGEILVVEIWEKIDPREAVDRMNSFLPPELAIINARIVENRRYLASVAGFTYRIRFSWLMPWQAAAVRRNRFVSGFGRDGKDWILTLATEKNVMKTFLECGIARGTVRRIVKTGIVFADPAQTEVRMPEPE